MDYLNVNRCLDKRKYKGIPVEMHCFMINIDSHKSKLSLEGWMEQIISLS